MMDDAILLAEVAEVLAASGHLRCAVETDISATTGAFVVTLRVPQQLETLELKEGLQRIKDAATLRMLSDRYGIDPSEIDAIIRGDKR